MLGGAGGGARGSLDLEGSGHGDWCPAQGMDSPQQSLYLSWGELGLQGVLRAAPGKNLASWGQKEPWRTLAHSTDR